MPRLHELQRAFGAAIFDDDTSIAAHVIGDGMPAARSLDVYRHTIFAVLTDALRLTYPAVDRLVGPEFFKAAAAAFARRNPPTNASLNAYGGAFVDFLAEFPPAASIAYLPDVARLEWALNVAANAPDVPALDPIMLGQLIPANTG